MGCSTYFKNACLDITPNFNWFKFFSRWQWKFFSKFHFIGFFVNFIKTLGCNLSCCKNSCNLSSKEMSFLAWERWVWVNCSIKVSSQYMLYQASKTNIFWLTFWQLNPIMENVISYPVHMSVNTCSTSLNSAILIWLFNMSKCTIHNPVVFLSSKYLTQEA